MTWDDVQQQLTGQARYLMVRFAAQFARETLPAIAALETSHGPEVHEWLAVCEESLQRTERFARQETVSRFQLDLAAEMVRCAANATSLRTRQVGPSAAVELAELAYAAIAFAADSARVSQDARAAELAMQSARAAACGGEVPIEQRVELLEMNR